MEENKVIQVYGRCDEAGNILEVGSSVFLADTEGWVQIDEGEGDRYAHAQSNYFSGPLLDDFGVPLYRVVGGRAKERPPGDMDADRAAVSARLAGEDVRAERDRRLAESDITQLADQQGKMTPEERLAWTAYRQALRDVPEQEGFPGAVEWPEIPRGDEDDAES